MITKEELELREVREEMSFLCSVLIVAGSNMFVAQMGRFNFELSYLRRLEALAKRESDLNDKVMEEKKTRELTRRL